MLFNWIKQCRVSKAVLAGLESESVYVYLDDISVASKLLANT